MSADSPSIVSKAAQAIDHAVEAGDQAPSLAELASLTGVGAATLRSAFVRELGVSPKAYAAARKAERLRDSLAQGASVEQAVYGAGYGSGSRVYERTDELLGMTPAAYRNGAPGERIEFTFTQTSLGKAIVALSGRGVCMVAFGDSEAEMERQLRARFNRAEIVEASADNAEMVAAIVALVDHPTSAPALPLDVRGTAFQQQVWQALARIRPGETVTYAELARQIGRPSAVRAVAQACGANPIAVAIPCHRVVGSDGSLTGYRWGVERKRTLLERECSGG